MKPARTARVPPPRPPEDARREAARRQRRGRWAEAWVAWRYRLAGWRVAGRNVRIGHDEIDIVVERGGRVRFVEVRFVGRARPVAPQEAAPPRKRRTMARAAARLAASRRWRGYAAEVELVVVYVSTLGWPRVWRTRMPLDEAQ